ncbi:glucose-6-phosphate dehydrogenase [Paenibacillus protaetiae]|uniref:Glucose-6-phosphate 1-dehydrogenase n=1 Tax=Paenibacillus protaetiae TaxID=2509456 RepID=A0A4V0YF50_9BACL|nr:glucose-6-phosphate dehydrogenase [Paenibacillus protaetiae]QAY66481.1 glucose-6-phosphate dehydrogenase [Paenibacillus protaetiae]
MDMTFVLFGATGDLAKRKIFPALYNLFLDQKMPEKFSIIGLGRREIAHEDFQKQVEQSIHTFSRRAVTDQKSFKDFLGAFRYSALDVGRPEDYVKLLELVKQREQELNLPENRMFYLSVGPEFFEVIAANIQASGLGATKGWKRLIIEKPFGRDLQSARDLNEKLTKSFTEEEIYRIDHYLGKPMVQNLEVLENSNPVLHALWTNRYIANVQITASETVGVEERAGYYDHSGALRDMFQNHMLQLMMMIAMQLPKESSPEDVRNKKRMVMESLRPLQEDQISSQIVLGQYVAGEMNGQPVVGYKDEPGVAVDSQNNTFIAAKLWIDNYFWEGVPFYIRTGKRMKEKSTRIVIEFKEPLKSAKVDDSYVPNLLVIEIGPKEGITLQLNSKDRVSDGQFEPVYVNCYSSLTEQPEAYENLIYDASRGDATFFAHWNEVELSWMWVEPILKAVEQGKLPLQPYAAGSYGPQAAFDLLGDDQWWLDEGTIRKEKKGEAYAETRA